MTSNAAGKSFTDQLAAAVGLHRVWDRTPAVMASAVPRPHLLKAGVAVVLLVLKLICGLGLDNVANSPDWEVESESWPRTPFARAGVLVAAIGSAPGLPRRLPASCHALRVIYYTDDLAAVRENMLDGFFVGWPRRPSAGQHLAVLRGSYRSVVAIDVAEDRVAGFVNMIATGS